MWTLNRSQMFKLGTFLVVSGVVSTTMLIIAVLMRPELFGIRVLLVIAFLILSGTLIGNMLIETAMNMSSHYEYKQ